MFSKKNSLLFFLLFFMSSAISYSQNSLKLSIKQDLKLMSYGDRLGNKSGTLDLLTRVKYESKEKKLGFFVFGLEYEIAKIEKTYTRYGAIFGYSFNTLLNDPDFYVTPTLGIGNIARDGNNTLSFAGSLQFAYKITKRIKISSLLQITERTDLQKMYGEKKIRSSFFLGVEINLFNFK